MAKHWWTSEGSRGEVSAGFSDDKRQAAEAVRRIKADWERMLLDYSESLRKDAEK